MSFRGLVCVCVCVFIASVRPSLPYWMSAFGFFFFLEEEGGGRFSQTPVAAQLAATSSLCCSPFHCCCYYVVSSSPLGLAGNKASLILYTSHYRTDPRSSVLFRIHANKLQKPLHFHNPPSLCKQLNGNTHTHTRQRALKK